MSAAAPFLALVWSPPAAIAEKPDAIAQWTDRMFDRIDRFDPDKLISGVNALDSGAVIAFAPFAESNNDPAWVRRQAAAIAALRARCGAMTDEAAIYDLVRPTKSSHSHRTPTGDIHEDGIYLNEVWQLAGTEWPGGGNVRGAPDAPAGPPVDSDVLQDSTLNIALGLAAKGHRVFPLNINDKTPAMAGNWQALATRDPARIRELWSCPVFGDPIDYNIGIPLERNEVIVDVDVRDGKRGAESLALWEAINDPLPPTYEVRSWSGGRHLKFRHETSGFPKHLADDIDLKQFGGYVVGPGSIVNGVKYELVRDVPPAALPPALAALADGKPHREPRKGKLESLVELDLAENKDFAIGYLKTKAPEAIEGAGGDLATLSVANGVGDFGISQRECLDLMAEHWNDTKAVPPWDIDDLAVKVANAYRYRREPLGKRVVKEFEAVAVSDAPPDDLKTMATGAATSKPKGFYYESCPSIEPLNRKRKRLIAGWLNFDTVSVMYGDSNVGKSFAARDMCWSVGRGTPWNGCETHNGVVVYVAAEGGFGIRTRIKALRVHRGDAKFALVPCPIDLRSGKADANALIALIREVETEFGEACVLLVIDTLSRAMAGGDENSSTDMAQFVANVDRIRDATKSHVLVIHHTGKDKTKGARGHSSLRAAADTELEVTPRCLTATKQRDMEGDLTARFILNQVEVGDETTCLAEFGAGADFEPLKPENVEALDALEVILDEKAEAQMPLMAKHSEWKNRFIAARTSLGKKGAAKSIFDRSLIALVQCGFVAKNKQGQYVRTKLDR